MKSFSATIDTMYEMIITTSVSACVSVFPKEQAERPHDEYESLNTIKTEDSASIQPISQTENVLETFKPIAEILKEEAYVHTSIGRNTIMYSGNIAVPVYKNPTIEFDTQIATIPYGEIVMMLEPTGRFFKIVWGTVEGWVLREDLADRAIHVYPEFVRGEENTIDHVNTVRIRSMLKDPFGMNRSEFGLQAGEYVLYRLWRKGIHIEWPSVRPRTPGLWHSILRGVPRIHMSVTPKVGAVMEYLLENEVGHLAYVEAVFPDNTITISEVNYPDSSIYNERELPKDTWRELKPVFISVT